MIKRVFVNNWLPEQELNKSLIQKRLNFRHTQIQFGECTGDLCSETEWKILGLTKKQMTTQKLQDIEDKKWYQILKEQYIELFCKRSKIRNYKDLDMNTDYPYLLDFTKRVLHKLKKKFP